MLQRSLSNSSSSGDGSGSSSNKVDTAVFSMHHATALTVQKQQQYTFMQQGKCSCSSTFSAIVVTALMQ